MKTIYLIRHSAPFVKIDNYRDYENVNWEEYNKNMILSVAGEENAKKLCELKELQDIDEIFSSDSCRAIGTAKYIAELNKLDIGLDPRINERNIGINKIAELPVGFAKLSLEDKKLKVGNGESLEEVDKRFNTFLQEVVNNKRSKTAIVMHGMILLSYLKNICDEFKYDGKIFDITYNNKKIIYGDFENPSVFKIDYDDKGQVINVERVAV